MTISSSRPDLDKKYWLEVTSSLELEIGKRKNQYGQSAASMVNDYKTLLEGEEIGDLVYHQEVSRTVGAILNRSKQSGSSGLQMGAS